MSNSQKGFAPIIIILGIVLLLGIAGGAYYFGKNSNSSYKNNIITTATPIPSPIPTSVQNQTSCEVSDPDFCSMLVKIQPLIANRDFGSLASYIDLSNVTCSTNPDVPSFTVGLCEGLPNGQVTQGYNIGYNQSEGAIVSKNNLVSTLNSAFTSNNYTYRGSLIQDNKGEIVYLTSDKQKLFVLSLKKNNSIWRIKLILLGIASNDYINLDPIIFSYMNL